MSSKFSDPVAYYSEVAHDFHASYRHDANRLERIRVWQRFFDRWLGEARFAYDVGCGSGILACELGRRGIEVIGIDGAGSMLAIAEETAREQGLVLVSFQQHLLPISAPERFKTADAIISSSALEYLDSISEALTSLHKMLRPQGFLIFSVSNRDSLSRKGVRAVHFMTGRPKYFGLLKQFMTVDDVRRDLQRAGFTYIEHQYFAKADKINRFLGKFLPERFASNMIIAVARRN
jgi:2-polyprenyl-3-methyl-5-hydroxy-6-metoxy-1,4-benzoquinol methylase